MSDQDAKDYKEQLDAYMNLRKNADGQAGQELAAWTAAQGAPSTPSQEGHAAGPACSAPDEALIEEILELVRFDYDKFIVPAPPSEQKPLFVKICKAAILEYIRRSAGKE